MALEIYSDIPLENTETYPHKILNEESVKQAITMMLTAFDGLRLFRPELDMSLDDLLWDNLDDVLEFTLTSHIIANLEAFDSRIIINDVVFKKDQINSRLEVTIYYSIKGFEEDNIKEKTVIFERV
jgi:phage baseplate assembly protein W